MRSVIGLSRFITVARGVVFSFGKFVFLVQQIVLNNKFFFLRSRILCLASGGKCLAGIIELALQSLIFTVGIKFVDGIIIFDAGFLNLQFTEVELVIFSFACVVVAHQPYQRNQQNAAGDGKN